MNFDRTLSLAIDKAHDELDRLSGRRGLRIWVQQTWWIWKLRRLEARIP